MDIDFGRITACGGDCSECEYFQKKECESCNKNGGICVKLWKNGCPVSKCCNEQGVRFCGLCGKFPCKLLEDTLTWDNHGIAHLKKCSEEYYRRKNVFLKQLLPLWKRIGTHGVMTLSTCLENRVTSRSMSVTVHNGKFYCQTDRSYLKCRQIECNPNVALCLGNISIEGICRIIGKPYEYDFFIDAMKAQFPDAVERWSALPDECVLEITPKLISSWIYEDNKPYIERWDFENYSYVKELQL